MDTEFKNFIIFLEKKKQLYFYFYFYDYRLI